MQEANTREAIRVEDDERLQLKIILELYGAMRRMMEATKLSRRAIENFRDNGRAERRTVEKVRAYLAEKAAGEVQPAKAS